MKHTVDGPGTVVPRFVFLTACLVLLPAAVSFAQSVSFLPTTEFPTGSDPRSVAVGDFNGDGRLDLAVANGGSNTVSILLGTGTGAFSAPTNFPVGSGPNSVAVGDFNADGRLDLAVPNLFTSSISILINTTPFVPAVFFAPDVRFGVETSPFSVATGDFNGDGNLDLAVANQGSESVSILLGTGTGLFSPAPGSPIRFPTGSSPDFVAVGDFNGDGILDLAVANGGSNTVAILLGTGTGAFSAPTNFAVGTNPFSVGVGDFNGDGKPDLAVTSAGSNTVCILLNATSSLSAVFIQPATNFPVGTLPHAVAVGDFDGDGILDLAVANSNSNTVSVLIGTGTGTFRGARNFPVGTNPFSVAVGDFNGDGTLDLAVANVFSDSVSILLNNGRVLTVTKDGTGSGRVTSDTGQIDCGVTCEVSFERGTMITVTAAPDAGSVFAGWSGGGCSGTDTCRIRMDAETSVTATFDLLEDGGHDAAAAAGGQHASYGGSVRTGYTRSRAARLTSGTFVLDESVSSLTMSGTLAGVSFQPQGPGADVTSYSGTITADFDLDAGTIRFSPGGAAVAANSGNWEPRRDGSAGREPANYGGQAGILIRLAFRDLAFSSVTDQPIPLTPAGAGVYTFESLQGLTVTAGSAAYAGFFGSGSVDLTGLRAQNSAAPGTLRDFGDGTFGLTMPIEATYTQDIGGRTATVHLSGSITGIALPDGASAR